MDEEYSIKINNDEGYSPEAIANFERSVEEFAETLLEIKPEHANTVSYTHLRAHETDSYRVCRLLLEKI